MRSDENYEAGITSTAGTRLAFLISSLALERLFLTDLGTLSYYNKYNIITSIIMSALSYIFPRLRTWNKFKLLSCSGFFGKKFSR